MSVRVRFAPSPTGYLHVGGARTALFNYLFAKKHKGSFVLRVEDTDQDRNQESALIPLLTSLKWLGLDWDEGPIIQKDGSIASQGLHAPYRQTERLSIYKEKALELIKQNKAYYCFMSEEEEAKQKEQALKERVAFKVSSPYRNWSLNQAQEKMKEGVSFCIRFKTKQQTSPYHLKDLVRGELSFPGDSLGDFVLIRGDGFPVYNFSCAVDDSLMEVTHVFRGEEHLSNSLKQRLIQSALNLKSPEIGHLSIILDRDKKKLSKRSGAQSVEHYKEEGYLPSTLINFLSLLGWNPKTEEEFFEKPELIKRFNIEGLNASSAIFDTEKLLWLNEQHLKKMTEEDLIKAIQNFLTEDSKRSVFLHKAVSNFRPHFKTLKQAGEMIDLILKSDLKIDSSAEEILKSNDSKALLEDWLSFLNQYEQNHLTQEDFKKYQSQSQFKGKAFFKPLRCALIGKAEGIEIKLLVTLLSREELIKRAKRVLGHISSL